MYYHSFMWRQSVTFDFEIWKLNFDDIVFGYLQTNVMFAFNLKARDRQVVS